MHRLANDMSDSDGTPMRATTSITLGYPIKPPSAFRPGTNAGDSTAGIAVIHRSTELVAQSQPISPSPNSLTAMQHMECRDELHAGRAEYALAVAEIEEARGAVLHARPTGEQLERVAKQTVAEARIRCEIIEH